MTGDPPRNQVLREGSTHGRRAAARTYAGVAAADDLALAGQPRRPQRVRALVLAQTHRRIWRRACALADRRCLPAHFEVVSLHRASLASLASFLQ